MKNKKEKIILRFFISALGFVTGFFIFGSSCEADGNDIVINEIMYNPEGTDGNNEWVKLYNNSDKEIILDGWDLDPDEGNYYNLDGLSIKSKDFLLISGLNKIRNEKGQISLYNSPKHKVDTIVDYIQYRDNDTITISENKYAIEARIWSSGLYIKGASEGNSLIRKKDGADTDIPDDWEENLKKPEPPKDDTSKKVYSTKIIINELLPNPIGSDEENEYIELYNSTKDNVDLSEWILKDKSAGKYVFPKNSSIKATDFLVIYRKDFSFAINNSDESIYLLDPNEKIVSEVSFSDSAKENISYAFDSGSSTWRWTKLTTPGKENQFEKVLSGKIKMDEDIYTDIYANFEAETDKGAQKFTWDFGDFHKSYLQKTTHKYEKAGVYLASLKISGDGEDNQYNFTVSVKDYEAPEVKIIRFSPNPKGKDTENEWLEIKNSSKTKINLNGWSIATGWKTLSNHPIKKDFLIKPGKTKKLTRKFCAFTLNNSRAKIELRTPDGETVQKIKYNREKDKIKEDEIFDAKNKSWENTAENTASKNIPRAASGSVEAENPINNSPDEIDLNLSDQEIQASLGKYSQNPIWTAKQKKRNSFISYATYIKTPTILTNVSSGRVAGVETAKNIFPPEKHWAVKLTENVWLKTNLTINRLMNSL